MAGKYRRRRSRPCPCPSPSSSSSIIFDSGTTTGTTALLANIIGEGDHKKAERYTGQVLSFGILFFPRFSIFAVFALMAAVLMIRPWGLLGRPIR